MMLGGAMSQIGWLVLGFGSIFFWVFAWHADLSGWRFQDGVTADVEGQSLGCRDTGYSVGGSENSRGMPVCENRYWYRVDGYEFRQKSYSTGTCVAGHGITVEYPIAQPGFSRVLGMRHGLLSPWAVLVTVLPGAGLMLAVAGLRPGRTRVRLLRDGLPAAGRLVERKITGSQTMGKAEYRVIVQFQARDGSFRKHHVRHQQSRIARGRRPGVGAL